MCGRPDTPEETAYVVYRVHNGRLKELRVWTEHDRAHEDLAEMEAKNKDYDERGVQICTVDPKEG